MALTQLQNLRFTSTTACYTKEPALLRLSISQRHLHPVTRKTALRSTTAVGPDVTVSSRFKSIALRLDSHFRVNGTTELDVSRQSQGSSLLLPEEKYHREQAVREHHSQNVEATRRTSPQYKPKIKRLLKQHLFCRYTL